jgi:hypothetical protein
MLSSLKGVKMTSLTEKTRNIVQNFIITEVISAKTFRMMQVYTPSLGKNNVVFNFTWYLI